MATIYDEFIGSRGNLKYVENPTVEYPLADDNTVLGTTFMPRVYGKDLQAFEIASTGIIAVTLDDIHSIDLTRNTAESNVILSTLCNDSFEINVNGSNVTVKADGENSDLSFYALRDINAQSDRSTNISALSNVSITGQQDVDITASNNASFVVTNELSMSSTTFSNYVGDDYSTYVGGNMGVTVSNDFYMTGISMSNTFSDTVTIQAGQNLALTGDNSAFMATLGHLEINAADNSMAIIMDDASLTFRTHTDHKFFGSASNEYRITTSNDFIVSAQEDIILESKNMSNVIAQDYVTEVGNDMDIVVASNIGLSSTTMSNVVSEDYTTEVGGDMVQLVELDLKMESANMSNLVRSDYNLVVGADMTSTASNNVIITAEMGSLDARANQGAMTLFLDSATDTARLESINNISVSASNDMFTIVDRDMVTTVTGDVTVSATTLSNVLSMDHTTSVGGDMTTTVTGDVTLSATTMSNTLSQDYITEVGGDMSTNVTGHVSMSNQSLSNFTTSGYSLEVGNDVLVSALSNITLTADGSYDLTVNTGSMTMNMDATTNDISFHADHDFITSTSNDTFMDTKKDVMIRSKDVANDYMHFMQFQSSNAINFSTTGAYHFNIRDGINGPSTSVLSLTGEDVNIHGNLNIGGVINSTSIVETRLEIEDKTLYLATNSNFVDSLEGPSSNIVYSDDGVANDGAGIRIHGFPTDAIVPSGQYQHDVAHLYEKSFKWNHRTSGVTALGSSNLTEEARWELKGGSLYLTNQRVDENGDLVSTTSFGFRVNQRDELEMIKEFIPVSGTSFTRRVAKFGFNL